MAQTGDGFLWLAGRSLVRFDGLRFERIPPAPRQEGGGGAPRALTVDSHGTLWVGYDNGGGVAVYRNGRLSDASMPDPPPVVTALAAGPGGTVWATAGNWDRRLWRWAGGSWERFDDLRMLPEGGISNPHVSRNGTLWLHLWAPLQGVSYAVHLKPGAKRFTLLQARGRYPGFATDRGGNLWISDSEGTGRVTAAGSTWSLGPVQVPAPPAFVTPSIGFDGRNALWGAARGGGVFHAARKGPADVGPLELFGEAQGLSSDRASAVLPDREGNIWIGTTAGIDRFRPVAIVADASITVRADVGLRVADSRRAVFIYSGAGVHEMRPDGTSVLHPITGEMQLVCPARNGSTWLMSTGRAVKLGDPEKAAIPIPGPRGQYYDCAEDASGRLWLTVEGAILWHDVRGWHRLPTSKLGSPGAQEIVAAPDGSVVVNLRGERIGILRNGQVRVLKTASMGIGYANGVSRGRGYAIVDGATGIARLLNGKVSRIEARSYAWAANVRDTIQTAAGDTWLLTAAGLVRVRTAQLDRAFDNPGSPVDAKLFDDRDGLTSSIQHYGLRGAQMAAGADGSIWILTASAVFRLDPRELRRNPRSPQIRITGLTAGGMAVRDPTDLEVAKGTSNMAVSFSVLSLSVPDRNQVRYRLEGLEDGWTDPGTRRQAFYTGLGPGTYRFLIAASNEDGVWSTTGPALRITIPPTFLQSWFFKGLCLVTLLACLALLHRLRLNHVSRQLRATMQVQLSERERIARELHDTLLQSIQGLILRLQAITNRMSSADPARAALQGTVSQANEALVEGRDRLLDLRSTSDAGDVAALAAGVLAAAPLDAAVDTKVVVAGSARSIRGEIVPELKAILSEAVFNAARHAQASAITVQIGFTRDLAIVVEDDGIGFASEPTLGGTRFGLRGMKERAARLGGTLKIDGRPGEGSRILLSVPGRIAFG